MALQIERVRLALGLVLLAALLAGIFAVLRPFFNPLAWAVVIVLTIWPLYRALLRRMPRRPGICAAVMTLVVALSLALFLIPLLTIGYAQLGRAAAATEAWLSADKQTAPEWLRQAPVLGPYLADRYQSFRHESGALVRSLAQYQPEIVQLAAAAAKRALTMLFRLLVCLFAVYFMFRHGRFLAGQLRRAAERLGGENLIDLLERVRLTVRAAVYGVLATACVQGFLAGIGFGLAGAPFPVLLGFAIVFFSLIPFGPPFLYLPVAALLIAVDGNWLGGLFLAVWGIAIVSAADNLLRPYFLSRNASIPLLIGFIGIIGGLTAFGFIGIFLGPTLMAVGQALWEKYLIVETPAA